MAQNSKSALSLHGKRSFVSNIQYEHLLAGVSGGVTSTLILHPFDLIKIRFAVDDGLIRTRPHYSGVWNAVGTIFGTEGVRGLYRGVTPNICGAGSSWGLYFFIYGSTKSYMQDGDSKKDIGILRHLTAASVSGVLTLAVTNPIWVVKTRLCLQYTSDTSRLPETMRYGGMLDAFRKTYRHEGWRGLYKGFVPGVWGVSHGAIQFMAYEQMKTVFNRRRHLPIDAKLSLTEYMSLAAASKMLAAIITYPYQVVRARLQDHHSDYRGSMDVVRRTLRYEGVRGLYKGFTPYMCHVLPNICLVFGIYEMFSDSADK